ncbi:Nitronate monooxygenase [Kingella potus]|uniref:Nitronate monooxygenase n=1 Tax=Kingella potus TaxID=265175 RepID=A0A377QYW0_9NEIS|nr:nitronate monooxygenase [Kingella potus]STR00197.1 Nitronate monooxygenase [Kingella potus]
MSRILSSLPYPVIQAPMAFAHDTALPLAVCRAGGLGSLACAAYAPDTLEAALHTMNTQAQGRPYNANFFAHRTPQASAAQQQAWLDALQPFFAEFGLTAQDIPAGGGRRPFDETALRLVEQYRPPVVSFHFGLPPAGMLARVKQTGAEIWASATTVAEARFLEAAGADAVIAQGWEAGGHRGWFLNHDAGGQSGLFALLPALVRAVKLPVIAAGGIADAQTVRAARCLGAAAVQAGTAFLLADEALAKPEHRAALQAAQPEDTAVTNLFSGGAARGITNRFMREAGPSNPAALPFPLAGAAASALRAAAEARGSYGFTPFWAGQNASRCTPGSAAQIVSRLAAGWD